MNTFKFLYRMSKSMGYEGSRKIHNDKSFAKSIEVEAENINQAKRIAKQKIKGSKAYSIFDNNLEADAPRPRIMLEEIKDKKKSILGGKQ